MTVLGVDWMAEAAGAFGGALYSATITRKEFSSQNTSDPSGPANTTTTAYTADAVAIQLKERNVDGTKVKKAELAVLILRGTVKTSPGGILTPGFVPAPSDTIAVPPPGGGSPVTYRVLRNRLVSEAHVVCEVAGPPI